MWSRISPGRSESPAMAGGGEDAGHLVGLRSREKRVMQDRTDADDKNKGI